MKILLSICIFCCVNLLLAQKQIDFIPLSTIDPSASNEDLKQLDSIFTGKRLIGLGESTHGTSEFTTMRHRIFKYLVENHGYNTFFLEADYSACKRVNRYIHGADDYVDSALNNVLFFPWMTREMSQLIEWMRAYNQKNGNVLSFVGCDMQIIEDELCEAKKYLGDDHQLIPTFEKLDSLLYGVRKYDSLNLIHAKALWLDIVVAMNDNKTSDWQLTKQGINYSLGYFNQPSYNYRDSCMAENINLYLELNPDSKAIFSRTMGMFQNL